MCRKSYVGAILCLCDSAFIFFGNRVSYSIVILTIHLNCQLIPCFSSKCSDIPIKKGCPKRSKTYHDVRIAASSSSVFVLLCRVSCYLLGSLIFCIEYPSYYISWFSRLRIETFSSIIPLSDEMATRSCSIVSR